MAKLKSWGTWTIARYRGAPVRLHASLILGALFFSYGAFAPGAWLGFALVILVHELGHAVLVTRYRYKVVAIDLHAFGGECSYRGDVGPFERSVIAWGGVLGQALLFAGAQTIYSLGLVPSDPLSRELLAVFVGPNVLTMMFNLLPIAPLDGSRAWSLFGRLWARRRQRVRHRKRAARSPEDARRRARAAEALRAETRAADANTMLSDETMRELERVMGRSSRDDDDDYES
jgi:Zn-dependent protease